VHFKQLDSQRFAISFTYNPEAIQDLKDTFDYRDREWHPDSKTWRFPLPSYRDVQAWALKHFPANEISPLEEVRFLVCRQGISLKLTHILLPSGVARLPCLWCLKCA